MWGGCFSGGAKFAIFRPVFPRGAGFPVCRSPFLGGFPLRPPPWEVFFGPRFSVFPPPLFSLFGGFFPGSFRPRPNPQFSPEFFGGRPWVKSLVPVFLGFSAPTVKLFARPLMASRLVESYFTFTGIQQLVVAVTTS